MRGEKKFSAGSRVAGSVLEVFGPVVDLLADLLGRDYEVVLHDFSKPEATVVKIKNGHVTGRSVGSTITDLGLQQVHRLQKDPKSSAILVNYPAYGSNGRELRCGSLIIRTKGKCVGSLCINIDLTQFRLMQTFLSKFCTTASVEAGDDAEAKKSKIKKGDEKFVRHFRDLMSEMVNAVLKESGVPAGLLDQDDRLLILKKLEERGVFLLRGAVPEVSRRLGLSESSVYRYLAKQRRDSSAASGRNQGLRF